MIDGTEKPKVLLNAQRDTTNFAVKLKLVISKEISLNKVNSPSERQISRVVSRDF